MKLFVSVFKNRQLLQNLIKNDFKNRYLGNHLGIIWAFVNPLVMIGVYWFVFSYGLRQTSVGDAPFFLWLFTGLVPWFLISEGVVNASNSIVSQSFLVKKIVFEVELLPIVKIGSALLVNCPFWFLMLFLCLAYGYYPNLEWLQLIYYLFCIFVLSLALGLLTSSIIPFIPDVAQVVAIIMQIMFWATPILWNKTMLTGNFILLYELNPFAYITTGVRDSLLNQTLILVHYRETLYFWFFVLLLYWVGNYTFNKLRPHFSDVL